MNRNRFLTHIIPILVYLSLAVVTWQAVIISEGHIIHGEFIKIPEVSNYFRHMYPLWNDQLSVPSIFSLPKLPILAPFFGLGLALDWTTTQMVTVFSILAQALAGISMYYAARYLLHKAYKKLERITTLAALIAGIIYMWSPYLVGHLAHTLSIFAYGIAPLLLLCLIKGIEERKVKYIVLSGLLWSLASADPHWMVYGAILIGGYILYSLLITLATKSEALTSSVRFQAKSLLVLIGSYVGFSAYWLVPGQLQGGTALYPHTFTPADAYFWFGNASLLNLLRGQAYYFIERRFIPVPELLSSTTMQMVILIFSFGIAILAISALLFKPKNRHVLFLSLFLVISILLATGPNLEPRVYGWFVFYAPLHSLYGWAFKTPGIHQFIILCFSFLSAFTLREILSKTRRVKLANINLHRVVVLLVLLAVFLPSWPLATGDRNGTLRPTRIPREFEAVNTWLRQQPEDFKVLWMPKYSEKGVFWNPGHSTKRFDDMFSAKPTYLLLSVRTEDAIENYYFFSAGKHASYPSLLYDNKTKELGKSLAPLGIKYLIFHDDMPMQAERFQPLLNNLLKQNDLELVKREGFIWVFENKYYSPHFSISAQNLLIMGGLENLATLSSAPGFEPANTNTILADQELYQQGKSRLFWDSLVSNGSITAEDLIFTLIEDEEIIIPSRGTTHFDPGSMWSRTTAIRHEWHIELEEQGLANWDFDYGKGLVFTWASDILDISFSVEEPGSYDLFTRYFQNENGGMIRIWLDDEPTEEVATESSVNGFVWRKVGSFDLNKGKHGLNLENVHGFNAVNLFALLASEKARQYEEQAEDWVRNKRIIHILEAEAELYYQKAEVSERYSGEASNGEVLQFSHDSRAWREIEILKDGDYRMAVRLEGSALMSIDDQSFFVNSADLSFAYLAPIYLKEGKHRIEIRSANEEPAYLDVVWLYSVKEESDTLEAVFVGRENPAELVSYQKINATKYRVKVSASKPFMLSFTEAYNPLWVAKVNGKEYASLPLYSVVNGFWVEDNGELEITIEYKPQIWFYYGAAISAVSFFGLLAYLLWDWRRERLSKAPS